MNSNERRKKKGKNDSFCHGAAIVTQVSIDSRNYAPPMYTMYPLYLTSATIMHTVTSLARIKIADPRSSARDKRSSSPVATIDKSVLSVR